VETYLDKIVAWHRHRATGAGLYDPHTLDRLNEQATQFRIEHEPRGFVQALRSPGLSVIAEVKRQSPSKGVLVEGLDVSQVAREYATGGAAALSVLTDSAHFGGSEGDLREARAAVSLPVIRKDFTVCEADVLEAVCMGADCVLLIVAVLSDDELHRCATTAATHRIDVLWETHDEHEVQRIQQFAPQLIGVNQRDLQTFQVDQERAVRVASCIPDAVVKVAESGVRGPDDARVLSAAGYDAVLVGESIVTSSDRARSVRALINAGQPNAIESAP
jgi:indole-3-glycerol phosphate synthase